jgi:peptidoglycan hydrolase-like protein with peptidoglycan-binding domain
MEGQAVMRRAQWLGVGTVVVLALAGCSDTDGDGDVEADPVAAAEARVERAETAVGEANVAFDEASTQFCADSQQYIESVDRYGGVLTEAEATVGAVNDAGRDLEAPREAVGDSVGDVQSARDGIAEAEAELVEAQVALAEAQTGTTGTADTTTTSTTAPLVPEQTVARVEQAEADLAAAFEGVSDSTPLSEATAQVNAAAVSVQVAWMQVFASAGCLSDEQHAAAVAAVGDYTRALQSALAVAGYFTGEVDGVYGPETVAAVEQLQTDAELPVTGLVDQATAEALDAAVVAAGGDLAATELAHTAGLQTVLTATGHWTGPIDGVWTDELTEALKAFQTDLGVEPTGVVDPATIVAAQLALDELQNPTTTTTTVAPEGDDTTTTTP